MWTDDQINAAMKELTGIDGVFTEDLNVVNKAVAAFLKTASFTAICVWLDNLYTVNGLNPYFWRNGAGSGKRNPTPPVEMAKICNSEARLQSEAFLMTHGKWAGSRA